LSSFSAVPCSPSDHTQAEKRTAQTEAAKKNKLRTLKNIVQN